MNFHIRIRRSAQKALVKIDHQNRERIIKAIQNLSLNPRPLGCKKLSGRDAWRIRIGNYRVIYEIYDNDLSIVIVIIGHRKFVYK